MPAFQRPESKNAATTLTWMAIDPRLACSSACRCWRTTCSRIRARQITVFAADGQAGVRQQLRVLDPPARDRGHPHARGQHGVRRLPAPLVDHRPRRLSARASSRTAATGSCSRTACSCSRCCAGRSIVVFGGKTNTLIPLYAVGVFMSFTLSQAGMVRHHQKEREPHWKRAVVDQRGRARSRPVIVTIIIAVTKFSEGAWIVARRHSGDRVAVQGDQEPLRRCRREPAGRRRLQAPSHEPHRRGARGQCAPRCARSARVREVAVAQPLARGHGRLRRRGAGPHRGASGRSTTSTCRSRSCTRRTAS